MVIQNTPLANRNQFESETPPNTFRARFVRVSATTADKLRTECQTLNDIGPGEYF